jgi:hypothetical protein
MKLPGIFKSLGKVILNQVKKSPKTAILVAAGIIGGSAGAAVTKAVSKLPDIRLDGKDPDDTDVAGA